MVRNRRPFYGGEDVNNATAITPEQKQDLIRRGAIFGDTSNDRSKALV
ncbi:MAG: hypothetical protein GPJ16_06765 [Microcystis aeruginosa G11-04]|uniref:Uncharacterized protein n=1 Tax=Microcystis aeruginosa G11-04 TaxID=2685956 RepID=A0A966FYF6_MICAE|nr:hypothetical protein [Microcystis aeruginosa G11-04]